MARLLILFTASFLRRIVSFGHSCSDLGKARGSLRIYALSHSISFWPIVILVLSFKLKVGQSPFLAWQSAHHSLASKE